MDQEITQMCTSGSTDILIVATNLGSLLLFDLKNIDSNTTACDSLNYWGLLEVQVKGFSEMD